MKQAFGTVALAMGASAATLRRTDDCCFPLTASGGVSGVLGQLGDGQNRVNGSLPAASYCINSSGGITDSYGRGCILTPPTTQFQCDSGASPTSGFTVSSSGQLEYAGSDKFYACPATDSEYNIYTTPVANQPKCVEITLNTGGKCSSSGQSASSSAIVVSSTSASSIVAPSSYSASVVSSTSASSVTAPSSYSASVVSSTSASSVAASSSSASSQAETCTIVTQYVTVTATDCPVCSTTGVVYSSPSSSAVASTQASVSTSAASTPVTESSVSATEYTTAPVSSTAIESSSSVYLQTTASSTSVFVPSTPVATTTTSEIKSTESSASTSVSETPVMTYATSSTGTASASVCQTSLAGAYQTPHLIVPVCSESPSTAYGTSYNGQVNSTSSSIFNFDIPQSYEGMTCSVIFLFPQKSQLVTSDYTFNGMGELIFSELSSAASQSTSWSNVPSVKTQLNSIAIQEGNSYVVSTSSCKAGTVESIKLDSGNGLNLNFFEDWNPASLGLYMTAC